MVWKIYWKCPEDESGFDEMISHHFTTTSKIKV
jgi:hypothetical protein